MKRKKHARMKPAAGTCGEWRCLPLLSVFLVTMFGIAACAPSEDSSAVPISTEFPQGTGTGTETGAETGTDTGPGTGNGAGPGTGDGTGPGTGTGVGTEADQTFDDDPVVLEPAGSLPAASSQNLYASVVNDWTSDRDFEAWRCRGDSGVIINLQLPPDSASEFTMELANEEGFVGGLGAIWRTDARESSRLLWLPINQDTLSLRLENESQDIVFDPDQELLSADFILMVTSVRIGPGRRWSGYVNEEDVTIACQPFRMTEPVPTFDE